MVQKIVAFALICAITLQVAYCYVPGPSEVLGIGISLNLLTADDVNLMLNVTNTVDTALTPLANLVEEILADTRFKDSIDQFVCTLDQVIIELLCIIITPPKSSQVPAILHPIVNDIMDKLDVIVDLVVDPITQANGLLEALRKLLLDAGTFVRRLLNNSTPNRALINVDIANVNIADDNLSAEAIMTTLVPIFNDIVDRMIQLDNAIYSL